MDNPRLLRNAPITGRHDWPDSLQITPGIISASTDAQGGQTYFLRSSENENHSTLLDGMDIGSFVARTNPPSAVRWMMKMGGTPTEKPEVYQRAHVLLQIDRPRRRFL